MLNCLNNIEIKMKFKKTIKQFSFLPKNDIMMTFRASQLAPSEIQSVQILPTYTDNQFGFKSNVACSHDIYDYTAKTIITGKFLCDGCQISSQSVYVLFKAHYYLHSSSQ